MRVVSLLVAIALSSSAAAGESSVDRVKNLLAAGTRTTPQAVARAADEYAALREIAPDDARVDYVYAVALVNQHRHRQALPLVNRYLQQHSGDLAAQRARIFIELSIRQFTPAWEHAMALAPAFRGAAPGDAELSETARFLGTVAGYLELARPAAVDSEARSEGNRRLREALAAEYLAELDKGRQAVVDQLAEIEDQQKLRQDAIAAEQSRRQQATSAAIKENRAKIETGEQSLESGTEQVRDAQRQLSVINTQMASLMRDRAQISAQISMAQMQLSQIQQQVANSQNQQGRNALPAVLRPWYADQPTRGDHKFAGHVAGVVEPAGARAGQAHPGPA